jgi:hypothetical protein
MGLQGPIQAVLWDTHQYQTDAFPTAPPAAGIQLPRAIRRALRVTRRNSVKCRHGRMCDGSPA